MQHSIHEVLRRIHEQGTTVEEQGKVREVGMTAMRRQQGEAIQRLACEMGCTRTIETGFAFGASGLHMVLGMLEGGCDTPHHVAIDPFQERAWGNAGIEAFRRSGILDFLVMHEERSAMCLPNLIREKVEPFDLALVDGGHLFENAFLDLYFLPMLIRPGGLLVVDDIWMPGVRWAMDYFVNNLGWSVERQFPSSLPKRSRWRRKRPELWGVEQLVFQVSGQHPTRDWDFFRPFGDNDGRLKKEDT